MATLQDFDRYLNSIDLQEVCQEKKGELWNIINNICESTKSMENSLLTTDLSKKEELLDDMKDIKNNLCKAQFKVLKASGEICSDPRRFTEISKCTGNSHEKLIKNVSNIGLEFRAETPRNGDCFFEAVSDQLLRLNLPKQEALELRQGVIVFLKHNFMLQREDDRVDIRNFVEEEGFERYLEKMARKGEWADHVIAIGMAAYLGRDIVVVTSSPSTTPDENIVWIPSGLKSNEEPILLGHIWENHYQSLQPIITVCEDSRGNDFSNKSSHIGAVRRRASINEDEEDVATAYLMEIDMSKGTFSHRHKNSNSFQYKCERCRKPRGKRKGPMQTRANGCNAYISFRFVTHFSSKAVIIREKHNGHNVTNNPERHNSRPDPALIFYIETLIDQGKKPMEILSKVWKFARDHGQFNIHDRRYYLCPGDIKNICQSYKRSKRCHQNDAVAVHELCTSVLKDEILHYQELQEGKQPLLIVYQNSAQRERMRNLSPKVVFLDATYKGVTAYGYAFYTLVGRDKDRGTPLAYCIASDDNSATVKVFLKSLKDAAAQHGFSFSPRSFMVDRDTKEISAIKETFPHSSVLLCWFHVLQAIYRFLNKKESGISGNNNILRRKEVIAYIRDMKLCTRKPDFQKMTENLEKTMPTPEVTNYLLNNWCNNQWGALWSNYGRCFFHEDHDTNNLVERFFLGLKYHFLGGYHNHRVEDLLMLLHGNVSAFYNYIDELAKVGRLKTSMTEQRGKQIAETMLRAGFDQSIVWLTATRCMVPSQSVDNTSYDVDLISAVCQCPASTQGGMCKHIHLSMMVAEGRGINITEERGKAAQQIYDESNFFVDNDQLELINTLSGNVSVVDMKNHSCTCMAFSHSLKCVCLMVADMINPETIQTDAEDTLMECDIAPVHKETIEQEIQRKIADINLMLGRSNLETIDTQKKKSIICHLNSVQNIIQLTNFKKITKKKRQKPLHPYRLSKSKSEDHIYATGANKRRLNTYVHEDGRFKTTGRNKGSIRKPFV